MKMTRSRKRKLARGVGLPFATTALIAGGAHAADNATEESGGLEEITVTAQKRTEDLQKVPISIQVLGGERLQELQVQSFDDYAKYLPSVSYVSLGPSQSTLYFRGVATGTDGLHAGSAPATGTYLDEIPVTTIGNNLDIHVYDIQRVEALAGPQGTLYGASSLSGTLRIITNKPDASAFSAGYDLKADKWSHGNGGGSVEGFVNVPITDKIAVRLVGYYDYEGGYINNVPASNTYQRFAPYIDGNGNPTPTNSTCSDYPVGDPVGTICPLTVSNANLVRKNQNDVGSLGGRAALKIDLNDNWSIMPQLITQSQKATGDFTVNTHVGDLAVNDFRPTYNNDQWFQSALTVQGKIGSWELLYSGGWLERKVDNQVDYAQYTVGYDAYGLSGYYNATRAVNNSNQLIDPTQYTRNRDRYTKQNHEFRINSPAEWPVRATAGLFYQRQTDDIRAEFRLDDLYVTQGPDPSTAPDFLLSVNNQPGVLYLSQMDRTDRDYAVFTDVTWDILPSLKMSAGIRKFWVDNNLYGFFGFNYYETNTVKGCEQNNGKTVSPVFPVTGNRPCVDVNTKVVEDGETHRLNFTYDITNDAMVYTTYSTGFRPGGVNRLTTAPPYRSDTITNVELGFKTSWFDHRLRLNGAGFIEHWKNIQVATQGASGITSIANLGKARILGGEGELEWLVIDGLTLSLSGTYVDARTTTDFCRPVKATGQTVTDCSLTSLDTAKGSHLPVTPNFKSNMTARYKFDAANLHNYAQAAVVHQTSSTPGIENFANEQEGTIPGYTSVDFALGTGMGNWHAEAYIDNAFDKRAELSRLTECGTVDCGTNYRSFIIKPRVFGIKFGQKF
jgi:outer membrane receptor protein involved in Fe transport